MSDLPSDPPPSGGPPGAGQPAGTEAPAPAATQAGAPVGTQAGTATAPPGAGPPAPRRLVRRTDNQVIAGVASGVAAYLGIEPTIVRIGFVVLTVFGGLGVLLYVLGWLLLPADGGQSLGQAVARRPGGFRSYLGVALMILAVAILASTFSSPSVVWAVALIAFGVYLFQQDQGQQAPGPAPPGQAAGPEGAPPAATPAPPAAGVPQPAVTPAASGWGAGATTTEPLGWGAPSATEPLGWRAPPATEPLGWETAPPTAPPAWGAPPSAPTAPAWGAPPRVRRPRPFLGPLTVGAALIVTGLAVVLGNLEVLDLTAGQVLAIFLTVLGVGLLMGTWWGRSWGLIALALLLVPVVAAASLADSEPLTGGMGTRTWRPRTTAEVRPAYRLAAGDLIVDLSRVRFASGATGVEASVAAGRVLVVVPDDVAVDVRGRVGVGGVDLLDRVDQGVQVDSSATAPPARSPNEQLGAGSVRLDLHVGYGVVEVRRASDPRVLDELEVR
jgi:phage shock protein PspC (stress-responsive transcriptional regulator)